MKTAWRELSTSSCASVGAFPHHSAPAGSNSMFAAAQAAVADGIGVPQPAFVGVQNAAACLLTMASPSRVILAVRCAPSGGVRPEDRATLPRVTRSVLVVDVVLVAALAAWNLVLLR